MLAEQWSFRGGVVAVSSRGGVCAFQVLIGAVLIKAEGPVGSWGLAGVQPCVLLLQLLLILPGLPVFEVPPWYCGSAGYSERALEAEAECELTTLYRYVNNINSQDDPSRVQNRDILPAKGFILHNLLQTLSCVIHSDLVCSFQVLSMVVQGLDKYGVSVLFRISEC